MPAAPLPSGMKGWGLAAASSSFQRHGMPAEPGPAPAPRGEVAPAHPVLSGLGLDPRDSPRCRLRPCCPTARKEVGRAAVRAPPAPHGRYYPLRPAAPGRRTCSDPGVPTRPPEPTWLWLLRPRSPGPPLGARLLSLAQVRVPNCVLPAPNATCLLSFPPPRLQISRPKCACEKTLKSFALTCHHSAEAKIRLIYLKYFFKYFPCFLSLPYGRTHLYLFQLLS